jgi:hypothetical protein
MNIGLDYWRDGPGRGNGRGKIHGSQCKSTRIERNPKTFINLE